MISAVILTKNEEENILRCLQSLSWCDELIVVDDNSTDKTIEIAKKKGAKVYSRLLKNDFSAQRNFGLDKAKNDWVLFIDADEKVTSALWYEIMSHTNNPTNEYAGFYIKRIDTMWHKELKHGETGKIKLLRLAKKQSGKWQNNVHEVWKVNGKTLTLNNSMLHYPHPSVGTFLKEINLYTDLRSEELYKKKKQVNWWSIIFYPKAKFIHNYILRAGFLDGLPGLVFALMMSFHSFLVRAKLWLLWQKKPEE
jgi:glycosyltransferase involved in cell wall biosynthesis